MLKKRENEWEGEKGREGEKKVTQTVGHLMLKKRKGTLAAFNKETPGRKGQGALTGTTREERGKTRNAPISGKEKRKGAFERGEDLLGPSVLKGFSGKEGVSYCTKDQNLGRERDVGVWSGERKKRGTGYKSPCAPADQEERGRTGLRSREQ